MPLPPHPLTIHGGCNCNAIRYQIDIPALKDRPIHPDAVAANPAVDPSDPTVCRLPFMVWDHCNDCRRATGSLLPAWLCTAADTATFTCILVDNGNVNNDDNNNTTTLQPSDAATTLSPNQTIPAGRFPPSPSPSTITVPALTLAAPAHTPSPRTYLHHYRSSSAATRSFCSRCGTPVVYHYGGLPEEGFPEMLDFTLGTVDRADLEREAGDGRGWWEPDRQLWCAVGIPWLRRGVQGVRGQRHPEYDLREVVREEGNGEGVDGNG